MAQRPSAVPVSSSYHLQRAKHAERSIASTALLQRACNDRSRRRCHEMRTCTEPGITKKTNGACRGSGLAPDNGDGHKFAHPSMHGHAMHVLPCCSPSRQCSETYWEAMGWFMQRSRSQAPLCCCGVPKHQRDVSVGEAIAVGPCCAWKTAMNPFPEASNSPR